MATPIADSYTAPGGVVVKGGRGGAIPVTQLVPNGVWTWFTRPEVLQVGSKVYIGWVDSGGTCGATELDLDAGNTLKHFNLSATGLEVDDHNNTSFVLLPGGKLAAFYGMHNDAYFRYRVWDGVGAFDSPASWGAEQARGLFGGPFSYPNALRFSADSPAVWLFMRRWLASGRGLSMRYVPDLTGATPHAWGTPSDIYANPPHIPYWRIANDGVDTIHVAITDMHPVQGQSSLYHFKGQLVGGVWQWSRSDGTPITVTLPMAPTDATLVYDGSATKCWVSDCIIGADGHPRILWTRYPGNNGTQIELWHAKWTGSAWQNNKITDDGPGLYSPEVYYHGGLAFDRQDSSRVYLSAPISGVRQVQEWRTADDGATWAQHRVLTSGGTAGAPLRARPIGVVGGDGRIRLAWWEGTYTTYNSYNTQIKGSG